MVARSKALGIPITKFANQVLTGFNSSIRALGLLPCYSEPWASSAITDIRRLTALLLDKGHAYVTDGLVFFAVETFRRFGQVSGLDGATMLLLSPRSGQRIVLFSTQPDSAIIAPSVPSMTAAAPGTREGQTAWKI